MQICSLQSTVFGPLFPDNIFSLTFSKIPDISLTAVKFPKFTGFPDKWSPCTLYCRVLPPGECHGIIPQLFSVQSDDKQLLLSHNVAINQGNQACLPD